MHITTNLRLFWCIMEHFVYMTVFCSALDVYSNPFFLIFSPVFSFDFYLSFFTSNSCTLVLLVLANWYLMYKSHWQVSLPSLNSKLSHTFPLSSLADECARHFGIDPGDQFADEAGNYFALARIFPSSKVGKGNHVTVLLCFYYLQLYLTRQLLQKLLKFCTMKCLSWSRLAIYVIQETSLICNGESTNLKYLLHERSWDCNSPLYLLNCIMENQRDIF